MIEPGPSAGPESSAGRTVPGSQPRDSANDSGIVRGGHVLEPAAGRRRPVPRRSAEMPENWPAGSTLSEGYRYVDFSIRYLARQFDALGACRRELEVKVFGGADVLPVHGTAPRQAHGGRAELPGRAGGPGGGRFHRVRFRPGRNSRPDDSFHTGTGEVLAAPAGRLEEPLRERPSGTEESGNCAMSQAKNSRPDRRRFRRGSPDPERCPVRGPGDRGHRHGQRSVRRGRTDRANKCRTSSRWISRCPAWTG